MRSVVLVRQALGGIGATGDPPQQETADILGPSQRQDHRQPAARRAAADIGGQGIEPAEQFVQILGPLIILRLAFDRDAGGAGVAPVIDDDPIAGLGDLLAQRPDTGAGAPSTGLQGDKRAALAEDLVMNIDAADIGDRHGSPPSPCRMASDVSRDRSQAAIASATAPQATSTAPMMRPIQSPPGKVFSIRTSSAIAAIQARFMIPPTNNSAISIQQQPRQ